MLLAEAGTDLCYDASFALRSYHANKIRNATDCEFTACDSKRTQLMRKLSFIMLCAALSSAIILGTSQQASANQGAINVEVGTRIGLGDWADFSNPSLGGTIGGLYMVTPELALSGRIGYFYGLPKETNATFFGFSLGQTNIKTNELPILGGARYYLGSDISTKGVWVGGELGVTQITSVAWVENNDGERVGDPSTDSEVEFSALISGGYDAGDYGAKVGLFWIPQDGDDLLGLMLTIEADVFRF